MSRPSKSSSTRGRRVGVRSLIVAALGLFALLPSDPGEAEAKGSKKAVFEHGCRVQAPQKFLERRTFLTGGTIDAKKHEQAVRYRAERYGHVETDATRRYSGKKALAQATQVSFFGKTISVHTKVAPALACVEKRIRKTCTGKSSYTPKSLGGFRVANTYRGAEISNHLFGTAIDIDPDRNPCCGCVDPWPTHPLCKAKTKSVYERTALPKCWIKSFEHFGFDWLGHDDLEDTMHFEFLGDPDKITR